MSHGDLPGPPADSPPAVRALATSALEQRLTLLAEMLARAVDTVHAAINDIRQDSDGKEGSDG